MENHRHYRYAPQIAALRRAAARLPLRLRAVGCLALLLAAGCRPAADKAAERPPSDNRNSSASMTRQPFGVLPDGRAVHQYTLANASGMAVKITDYGAIITHLLVPDRTGRLQDVVLGFDSLTPYLGEHPYFGAVVGRYGNRIAKGRFTLEGNPYRLAVNNGPNHLHGGLKGFDKALWTALELPGPALQLIYTSPDGEEGYPGTLTATVTYTLTADNTLRIDYKATTDKPTVVNLTNHTYFNLGGNARRDVLAQELTLNASRFLPVDTTLIPTGELRPVRGTPFDFTSARPIGAAIDTPGDEQLRFGGGYDHCWVLDGPADSLRLAATAHDPATGRVLEVHTSEPAVQFYTGNFLDGTLTGKGGAVYGRRHGFCLETEHYPDSPNQPAFPSTVLRPGQTYRSVTAFRFSVR